MRYCWGENRTFPESAFRKDSEGRLVHPVGGPHYLNGLPVGTRGKIPTARRAAARRAAAKKAAAKRTAAKRASAKRTAAKRTTARRSASKKR
jgi:DNA-binding protein HU-beta